MDFPQDLKYTEEHEWIKDNKDGTFTIGITDFAQYELGDIVFIEIDKDGEEVNKDEVFGSVEAVKTVSDLFMPIKGKIIAVNSEINDSPEIVNNDPYGEGWLIKIESKENAEFEKLLSSEGYKEMIAL